MFFTSISYGTCVLIALPISGGCLNPAIGFSVCIVSLFDKLDGHTMEFVWVYMIFPCIGSFIAVIFYDRFYKSELEKS